MSFVRHEDDGLGDWSHDGLAAGLVVVVAVADELHEGWGGGFLESFGH